MLKDLTPKLQPATMKMTRQSSDNVEDFNDSEGSADDSAPEE